MKSSSSSDLPQVSPESYLKPGLSAILAPDELLRLSIENAAQHEMTQVNQNQEAALTEDEKIALTSVLRFIDMCLPDRPDSPRPRRRTHIARICVAMGRDILEHGFSDIDLEDLRQEARIAAARQMRKYDLDKSPSPLTHIPHAIASRMAAFSGRSLTFGLGQVKGYKNGFPLLSRLRNTAFISNTESGMSDRFQTLSNDPRFVRTEPLTYVPDQLDDRSSNNTLNTGYEPTVPEHDAADMADADTTLDKIFNLLDRTLAGGITAKHKQVLRMHYELGMTLNAISDHLGCSVQNVQVMEKRAIKRIQKSPAAKAALQELASF